MKTVYSEYVRSCMRFYTRYPSPKFRSDVDEQNWKACESALGEFTDIEKQLLIAVYIGNDTIPDNVYKVSTGSGVKQDTLWSLINKLEQRVAKRRNLI